MIPPSNSFSIFNMSYLYMFFQYKLYYFFQKRKGVFEILYIFFI